MKSIQSDVKNPLSINEIELTTKFIESLKLPIVNTVTQEEYDLMSFYDPHTVYVISDKLNRVYVGDRLITRNRVKCKYLLGTDIVDDKVYYAIYMNGDPIIEICRFSSSDDAVHALTVFNCIGNHSPISMRIIRILDMYNGRVIDFLTMMTSLLSLFGFKDSPYLQNVIEAQRVNRCKALNSFDVPPYVIALLSTWNIEDDYIVKAYAGIYQVFINNPAIIKNSKISEREALHRSELIKLSDELCQVACDLGLI